MWIFTAVRFRGILTMRRRNRSPTDRPATFRSASHVGSRAVSPERDLSFLGSSLQVPERRIRFCIAAMVPLFGAIAAVMLFSGEGPGSSSSRVAVTTLMVSTLPVGLVIARTNLAPMWWTNRSRPRGLNTAFVLYGDVGVSIVLFTFTSPEASLFGALLLAILSAYVAYFCSAAARNLHIALTTSVITVLSVLLWHTGQLSAPGVVGRFLVAVLVVNGTVLLQSMFAVGVRGAIRDTLVHAHQDPLTQLWNRRGFTYWAMATVQASKGPVGMLFVDIDGYKSINDTYGHRAGDDVLRLAARRLTAAVGSRGVLARTGGDEFAVAAELGLDDLTALAESIRSRIHQLSDAIPLTISIGVAAGPHATLSVGRLGATDWIISTMLQAADTALYEAKEAGRNRVAYVNLDGTDHQAHVIDTR